MRPARAWRSPSVRVASQMAPWTREEQHEEHAAEQAVGVEQGEQVALEERLRRRSGMPAKMLAKATPEQQRRHEGADHQAGVPGARASAARSTLPRNSKATPRRMSAKSSSMSGVYSPENIMA